jgi:hypothetical protein
MAAMSDDVPVVIDPLAVGIVRRSGALKGRSFFAVLLDNEWRWRGKLD